MPRKYGPRRSNAYKFYSVYNRKTDEPVFIHGTARECMAAANLTQSTFYTYASLTRNNIKRGRYEIYVDEEDDEDE